jgi:HSP20 family protein
MSAVTHATAPQRKLKNFQIIGVETTSPLFRRFDTMNVRWDPFQDVMSLSDAVSRLMQDAVMRPGFAFTGSAVAPMNVIERNGQYIIQVALPGVKPEDVDVTTNQTTLTIKAHRDDLLPAVDSKESQGHLLVEFGAGDFERKVTLPKDFDADHIEAGFDRGILTIVVPIAQHAQPKRIAVKEGSRTIDDGSKLLKELTGAGGNGAH